MIYATLLSLANPAPEIPKAAPVIKLSVNDGQNMDISKNNIILSPPIDAPFLIMKQQTHRLRETYLTRNSTLHITFKPTTKNEIIGYDIAVEVMDVSIEGDKGLSKILANTHNEAGTIGHYSYDIANDILTLNNGDELWQSFLLSAQKINANAGERSQEEQLKDKAFLMQLADIPVPVRDGILSEDMALILSFIGKKPIAFDHQIIGEEIIIKQTQERQGGKITENSVFSISKNSGLVQKMERVSQAEDKDARTVITQFQLVKPQI